MTSKVISNKKPIMTKLDPAKILGNTSYLKGFHFNTAIGNYTEKTAISLRKFANMLKTIDEASIIFHFQRQDFQRWIRDILGDLELADRMDKITPTLPTEDPRDRLVEIIQARIIELEKLATK